MRARSSCSKAVRIRGGITASILLFVPSPSHGLNSLVPWDSTASVADLETAAVNSPRILTEILVDNVDPLAWPAEPDGTVDQAVLKLGAFVMVPDLVDGGLAHVDVGESGAVGCAQPLLRSVRSGQHAGSPRSWGCSPACVAATRQELGRSVLASRPAGWARVAAGSPESKWTLEAQHDAGTVGWGPS